MGAAPNHSVTMPQYRTTMVTTGDAHIIKNPAHLAKVHGHGKFVVEGVSSARPPIYSSLEAQT